MLNKLVFEQAIRTQMSTQRGALTQLNNTGLKQFSSSPYKDPYNNIP